MKSLRLLRRREGLCAGIAAAGLLLLGTMTAAPARAEDDPYAVTVSVDATSDTIGKARDQARAQGERQAFATLVERLSGGSAAAKTPKLDDHTLADLVASFEVAQERMSAVRYIADITFHFRAGDVQRVLQKAGIATASLSVAPAGPVAGAESAGKSLIVIPVYQSGANAVLWDDPNPWREAWSQQLAASDPEASHFAVPLGDAGDIAVIDAGKARAGDAAALAAVAKRNGSDEAIVAVAVPRGPPAVPIALDIATRRYRAGQIVDHHSATVTANPGEERDQLFRRAVATITGDIESGWKKGQPAGYDQQGSLTAVLPITGLEDWLRVRDRLAAVPAIRKVRLSTLSLQEATIEIDYLGTIDQLKASLGEAKLDLVRGEPSLAVPPGPPGALPQAAPMWRLARSGAP